MSRPVRLAAGIPQTFHDGPVDVPKIRAYLGRVEDLGFESAWVVEQVLGSLTSLEPVELLTYAAACTSRIRLGPAVLLTPLRNPVHLAKSLATLDQLSGGRLIVGVGLGGNPKIYPAFGLDPARRVARFLEGLEVMRRLWTESRVTFTGDFYRLDGATMMPKPVQQPHPPLWFGAHHPDALRRTATLGAGFMGAGSASTVTFVEEMELLRRFCDEAGRDPTTLDVGTRVYVAIDRDRDRAGRRLTEWFGAFYGRPALAAETAVWGSVDQVAEGLRAVLAGGARLLMLNPVFDELEQLETLATEVRPLL